jgi:outer membrane protein
MKRIKILAVLFLLFKSVLPDSPALCGEAPPDLLSKPLTMDEAVTYGLEHNRSLKASQEEVLSVTQQVKQSRADFFPKIDAGYNFRHFNDKPFASFETTPGVQSDKFQTGYTNTNHWEVDLTQPLFTGFGLTAQFNISKMNLEISKYRMEGTRLDVIRNVKNAFLQTLLGEKLLQVAKDNVKSLEVQRSNAEAYFEQGLTPQNDVLKADVALADAKQRERTASKQVVILRSQLNQLLDLNVSTVLNLSDVEAHTQKVVPSLEQLYSLAEQQRPEYLSLDTSIRQAKEGIRLAKSRYYPQLSAFGQYYREGEDFFGDTNKFTNNENAAVGIRVDLNLFEGGKTHATVMEFEHRQKSLEQQRGNLAEQIKIQVEDAYEKLQLAKSNIHTAEVALKQANENERMTSLQYKNQLVIFLEVLNAQVFVLQSRVNYYQALYGYELAWADLERALGGPLPAGKN